MKALIKLLANSKTREEFFSLPLDKFIEEVKIYIPESKYLNQDASSTVEGTSTDEPTKLRFICDLKDNDENKNTESKVKVEAEYVRAWLGLAAFKAVWAGGNDNYEWFVKCQKDWGKPFLEFESFKEMGVYVKEILKTTEDLGTSKNIAAAIWSILNNDLGKVTEIANKHKELKLGSNTTTHDGILADMLKAEQDGKIKMFPSFRDLSKTSQQQIIDGYASGCDISQFEQLELAPVALKSLKKLDKKTLELYILHTIFDVAGAAGQVTYRQENHTGSLTMHEQTWQLFCDTSSSLLKLLDKNASSDVVFKDYVGKRLEHVGIKTNNEKEFVTLGRLAGMTRSFTKEHGVALLGVWETLPQKYRKILSEELNVQGDQDTQAIFVNYGVSILVNPQGSFKKVFKAIIEETKSDNQQLALAINRGLYVGLINLARVFLATRQHLNSANMEPSNSLFMCDATEIAKYLGKNNLNASLFLPLDKKVGHNSLKFDFKYSNAKQLISKAKVVIFDIDDTVLKDTHLSYWKHLNIACDEVLGGEWKDDEFTTYLKNGYTTRHHIMQAMVTSIAKKKGEELPESLEKTTDNAVEKFYSSFAKDKELKVESYPKVEAVLQAFKQQGVKLIAVSNTETKLIKKQLECIGFAKYFEDIEGSAKKPNITKLRNILKKNKIKVFDFLESRNDHILVIGDSLRSDAGAAYKLGCNFILFTGKYIGKEKPSVVPKDVTCISDYQEILDVIKFVKDGKLNTVSTLLNQQLQIQSDSDNNKRAVDIVS